MTGPALSCSCGWKSPDPGAEAFLARITVALHIGTMFEHWEVGHQTSYRPDLADVVKRAALALAARRRGVA